MSPSELFDYKFSKVSLKNSNGGTDFPTAPEASLFIEVFSLICAKPILRAGFLAPIQTFLISRLYASIGVPFTPKSGEIILIYSTEGDMLRIITRLSHFSLV